MNPAREALVLALGIGTLFLAVTLCVAFFVDRVALYLPVEAESYLFGFVDSEMTEDSGKPDPYLTDLVGRLAEGWQDNPYEFNVWLIEADFPNAMALPGGSIVVTEPLLKRVHSENALALVLGHELGHFRNRDHLRGLGRQAVFELLGRSLIGGANGAAWLFGHLGQATERRWSRGQESACDAFGLMLTDALYGHVNGASEFFEELMVEEEGEGFNYLRSHPMSATRLQRMSAEAELRGYLREGDLTQLPEF